MRILGVNAGRAIPPRFDPINARKLADGSAALLTDGKIECATIEERHTRQRYAGGFARSARSCLGSAAAEIGSVDSVGLSTCCDSKWTTENDLVDGVIEELRSSYDVDHLSKHMRGRVHCVDHHDSHAMLAFAGSGFSRSLVCVLDGFGNRRDDIDTFHGDENWWRGQFDRQTFYIAQWDGGRVCLERVMESSGPMNGVGLAELYRSVTHFMGWRSYQFAGKTMALAAYGDRARLANLQLADFDPDIGPRVLISDLHDDPTRQIASAIAKAGHKVPSTIRRPADSDNQFLADVAAVTQHQVESCLIAAVEHLVERHNISHVVFGGGLALNCIALGKLARKRPDLSLYVPPAPGDTGQGLGNALWLAYNSSSPIREQRILRPISTAALGPRYSANDVGKAARGFHAIAGKQFEISRLPTRELAARVVGLLTSGRVVAVRRGRAEYGPRALGNCSILCDPRGTDARGRVNSVKRRENFRPFAASVLQPFAQRMFGCGVLSPFMSFAGRVSDEVESMASSVVHLDGTSRFQTVTATSDLLFHVLIAFYEQTGLPLILNTSFNLSGEPMVESPADALDVFTRAPLDALVLGNLLIVRR